MLAVRFATAQGFLFVTKRSRQNVPEERSSPSGGLTDPAA